MRIGITFTAKNSGADMPVCQAGDANLGDAEEEFDSPETIAALRGALESLGHEVTLLGDGEPMFRRLLDEPRPEMVFNIAEGRGCARDREARVPAVLETLGIPYTGSDPLTLAAALDKDCAKRLVRDAGVSTPRWVFVDGSFSDDVAAQLDLLPLPVFIKPAFEGSSKGIVGSNLIADRAELHEAVARLSETYRQPILVEEFIDGDELTVGIIGHEPTDVLGIMRVVPKQKDVPFVYGLDVKRDWRRRVEYECPAQLSAADVQTVRRAALRAWRALGCRDVARLDFRLRAGVAYFLEANPLPGLAPGSGDLILMAEAMGVSHVGVIDRIVQAAIERQSLSLAV